MSKPIFIYGRSGSLLCDREIPGLTQRLKAGKGRGFYGSEFFIAESMTYSAARRIAEALNGVLTKHEHPRS